jgi:hypothetical protein
VPTSSPNRRACGESREGNGGQLGRAMRRREKERKRGRRGIDSRTAGPEWLQAAWSEAVARVRGGGGVANQAGRRGVGDAARLIGGARQRRGPVSATWCGRERGKQGSAAAGCRQADPASIVSDSAVQTRF